jgi:hypothetical protein
MTWIIRGKEESQHEVQGKSNTTAWGVEGRKSPKIFIYEGRGHPLRTWAIQERGQPLYRLWTGPKRPQHGAEREEDFHSMGYRGSGTPSTRGYSNKRSIQRVTEKRRYPRDRLHVE